MAGSKMIVRITGADVIRKRLAKIAVKWGDAVEKAAFQETKELESIAHDRTPRDKGVLRGTYETSVTRTRGKIETKVEVGGPAAPYALPVHERLELHHPHGEAKFLEKTWNEARPNFTPNLARRIKANHGLE